MSCLRLINIILLVFMLAACGNNKTAKENTSDKSANIETYKRNLKANVEILTYDKYGSEDKEGFGVQVDDKLVAVPYNLVKEASSVRSIYLGRSVEPMARGYVWYDISNNLVLLRISGPDSPHPPLASKWETSGFYGMKLFEGKMRKYTILVDSIVKKNNLNWMIVSSENSNIGSAVFNSNHQLAGVITDLSINGIHYKVIYPAHRIKSVIDTISIERIKAMSALWFKTDKVYPKIDEVSRFILKTDFGNITLQLSDQLPEYKKNFIKLSSDGYYDSLLIHRVLRNFLIQTGASDTRRAQKDDVVGYRGPGYSLPTIIIPGMYHKRGAVAASKLPKYSNKDNRSDGGQFYIVSGRKFNDEELDDLEEQKNIEFTTEQRNTYKTIGGAPYLDGDYTVFGYVTEGMSVVDSISAVATGNDDRPLKDIRIKTIDIVEK